ncbi:MAG: hypothetical protein ABEJ99_04875 [Candidatus Nanohaloarchaea archaeon]
MSWELDYDEDISYSVEGELYDSPYIEEEDKYIEGTDGFIGTQFPDTEIVMEDPMGRSFSSEGF